MATVLKLQVTQSGKPGKNFVRATSEKDAVKLTDLFEKQGLTVKRFVIPASR